MNKEKLLNANKIKIEKDTLEIDEILELEEIYYAISSEIINYRKTNNLTQKELADKLEINQTMISKLESGKYNPTFKIIYEISRKLKNSADLFNNILLKILKEIRKVSSTNYSMNIVDKNYNYKSEDNVIYISQKYNNKSEGGYINGIQSKIANVG